jgi:hypothetical protein
VEDVAIHVEKNRLIGVKFHTHSRGEITRSSFARVGGPKNQNPTIFYTDAASGQSSKSKTWSGHAEQHVKSPAIPGLPRVFDKQVRQKTSSLVSPHVDRQKGSLIDIDVSKSPIRERRELHGCGFYPRIGFTYKAPKELGWP